MKNLKEEYYNPFFSHIYVEQSVRNHPRTRRILERFPKAGIIEIGHYKDVFCRRGQKYRLQHRAQSLILAEKRGKLIYEGAPVCQSFGNENFYYTSCIMNCIYDCEYCYLKGMYPSGNIVVFVNLEDFFDETEKLCMRQPVYLCVSYDTDLAALEHVTGYMEEWVRFAEKQKNFKIEIRTKCADETLWRRMPAVPEVIFAFTLSPQTVIASYEHGTPSLEKRINCAEFAVRQGCTVRLCFDPMIYCPDWEKQYDGMLEQVFSGINPEKILDVSVGTFRVSQDYLKKMRKQEPYSAVVQFPYQNDDGVYHYSGELTERMERHMVEGLKRKMPEEKIFLWESGDRDR